MAYNKHTFIPNDILTAELLNTITDHVELLDNCLDHPYQEAYTEWEYSSNLYDPSIDSSDISKYVNVYYNMGSNLPTFLPGDYSENPPAPLNNVVKQTPAATLWSCGLSKYIKVKKNITYTIKINLLYTKTGSTSGLTHIFGLIRYIHFFNNDGLELWESTPIRAQYLRALEDLVIETGVASNAYYGTTYATIVKSINWDGIATNNGYKAIAIKFKSDGWIRVLIGHDGTTNPICPLKSGSDTNDKLTNEEYTTLFSTLLVNEGEDLTVPFEEYYAREVTKYRYYDKYQTKFEAVDDRIDLLLKNFVTTPVYSNNLFDWTAYPFDDVHHQYISTAVPSPSGSPTSKNYGYGSAAYRYGKDLVSGWVKITDAGQYTILQFKQLTGYQSKLYGYIGTVIIAKPGTGIVWANHKFYGNNIENYTGTNDYIALITTASQNMRKFSFEKRTDDELYVLWYMTLYQNSNPTGFYFPNDPELPICTDEEVAEIKGHAMLYKGLKSEFQPYSPDPISINYLVGIDSIDGLEDRLTALEEHSGSEASSLVENITIENSDKIGFFGNSFFEGYTINGHHPIVHLGSYLDYILYNYSQSGDDVLETLERVEDDKKKFNAPFGPKSFNLTYAVIPQWTNDGALHARHFETYYENCKKLGYYFKAYGTIPIYGTEHQASIWEYHMHRLCREEGYMFMDWGLLARTCRPTEFKPFGYNAHPATRSHWVWTLGMWEYLKTLPRPRKAIKLFTVRDESIRVLDLIYNTNVERARLWKDFSGGYTYHNSPLYFDRIIEQKTTATSQSQYMQLQAGNTVMTDKNKVLVEIITPYTAQKITSLKLYITASADKIYLKRNTNLVNKLSALRYLTWGIGDNDPAVFVTGGTLTTQAGTTGHIQGATQTGSFTIQAVVGNYVITTFRNHTETSGTDVAEATVNGVTILNLYGSYDYPSADYLDRWNKPLAEYTEIQLDESGTYTLDSQDDLKMYMNFDKIAIMLVNESNTGISIEDIHAEVVGSGEKNRENHYQVRKPIKGTSILKEVDFSAHSSNWTIKSGTVSYPAKLTYTSVIASPGTVHTEQWPIETVSIIQLEENTRLTRQITGINTDAFSCPMVQVRIVARRLPPVCFTDEAYYNNNVITPDYYPCGTLKIGLSSNNGNDCDYFGSDEIGLWWYTYIYNVPIYNATNYLHIYSESSWILIARIEIVQIDNYNLV